MADVDLKVRIDPNIEGESALNSLVSKLEGYANKPYTIKVKVEAVEGQKGLNNLINGIDKAGRGAYKQLSSGINNTNNSYSNLNRTMMKSEKLQQAIAHNSEKMQKSESESAKVATQNYKQQGAYAKIWDNMYKTGAASNKQYKDSIDYLAHRADLEKKEFEFREKSDKQISQAQRKADAEAAKAWDNRKANIEKQEAAWNKQFEKAGKPYEKELKEYDRLRSKIGEDSKAQWAAQKQTMSEQERIVKELNSWTAARTGKTADAYKSLEKQADTMARLNSEVKNGSILVGDYEEQYRKASAAAKEAEVYIQREGKAHLSFGDKAKNAFSELSRYITPAMALREGIQAVKQMAQASMEIESAMTRIQIVTGATDTQMSQFFETASSQAQELGKGITDVAGSIETFSRLGYNLNKATNLSKFANIMANVGDVSVDEATTGITSIIKGFDMEASDAEHVSDVLIEVGQKYAISASELMQAFERGGASMYASGTSFEKSAALFAATNAALQNSAKTGTLWNTVSARIRSATSELQEMGESTEDLAGGFSKYRDELLARTGVDIQDAAGNYRDMYDIFVDIAAVWDKMADDQSQSRVAEILGGTRNRAGIMSTIQNIRDAIGAYRDAQDSAGTAAEANALYMETTAAHVEQLKAAFQELSYDTFNGDMMKGFVDFGKGAVNVLDGVIDKIGLLGTVAGAVSLSSLIKQMKNTYDTSKGMIKGLDLLTGGIRDIGMVGGISAAIGVIAVAVTAYKKHQEELRKSAMETADEIKQEKEQLGKYAEKVIDLRTQLDSGTLSESEAYETKKQLLDIQNQLNESYGQGAESLNLINGEMETQAKLIRDLAIQEATNKLADQRETLEDIRNEYELNNYRDNGYRMPLGEIYEDGSDASKAIQKVVDKYSDLIKVIPQKDEYGNISDILQVDLDNVKNAEEAHNVVSSFLNDMNTLSEKYPDNSSIQQIITTAERMNSTIAGYAKNKDAYEAIMDTFLYADPNMYTLPGMYSGDPRRAIDILDDYADSINNYNDAILSGDKSKIRDARKEFESFDSVIQGMTSSGGLLEDYAYHFSKARSTLYASEAERHQIMDILSGEEIAYATVNKRNKQNISIPIQEAEQQIKAFGMTADQIKSRWIDIQNGTASGMDVLDNNLKALVSSFELLGFEVLDESGLLNDTFISALQGAGTFDKQAESAEAAILTLDEFSEYQSTLTSALNSSASATGLTTEQINELTTAYQGIEGFDPAKLFESTANGIHLNQEELESLNKEIELNTLDDYANKIQEAVKKYNDLNDARKRGENISDQQLKDAYDNIQSLKREESQYEGLISAFNKWQISKSQADERANYEAIGSGYEGIKDLVEHGWINDAEVGSYLDLVLGKVDAIGNVAKRSGDNLKDFAKLTETNEYGHNIIGDYWSYSEDGKLNPGGLQTFLEDVNQFDSSIVQLSGDADNTNAVINFTGDNLARVSREFGLSAEMIQLMERAMVDAGAAMVLDSDNISLMGHQMEKLDITSSGLSESMQNALSSHDWENLENWDLSELEQAATQLDSAINQLGEDAGDTKELFSTLQDSVAKQTIRAQVQLEMEQSGKSIEELAGLGDADLAEEFKINIDTSEGQAQLQALKGEIDSMAAAAEAAKITVKIDEGQFDKLTGKDQDMTVKVNYEDGSGEKPQETMDMTVNVTYTDVGGENPKGSSEGGEAKHIPVIYDVTPAEEPKYEDQNPVVTYTETHPPEPIYPDQNPSVTYSLSAPPEPSYNNISRTVTYTIQTIGSPPGGGTATAYGTMLSVARADGSMVNGPWNWVPAYSKGSVALGQDEYALTNELGQESIIRNGQWMMLPGGMHMEALKKGDIVLSAAQTEALLRTGKASGHAHAYALGTLIASAYGNSSLWKGDSGSWNYNKSWTNTNKYASSSNASSGSGSKKSSGGGNNSNDKSEEDEEPEIFDWIELAIDRIERAIKQLGITAKSTFKQLTTRLEASAEEIVTVTDEIELQQKAYERYIQQANSVGLSEELAERVRNGAIDINEYDKDTQELIDSYQEWYEKALDCDDAIQQLHEDLGQLYEDRFNDTKDDFDAQLSLLEHMTNTFENGMDDIEARGYLMTTKYYEAMRKVENQNIDILNKELDALIEKMSQAVNSGAIQEGSQAWYEMQQEINDVKEAIQEAETSVIEFGNSIREVLWDRFDYLQDRISQITDESDFLIDLLSNSKMHTDTGLFTNEGLATLGLHAQNYDVLMNQADRYAAEVEKLNKEIANDPNNTKLLEQKQEWIEAQRESILNAEEEKKAMISLVDEGMQHELDALNTLISRYKDSMDNAKNLYDYQKKVAEQSNKISGIQKQLRAYAGDDSEETRAVTQKLTVDLSDAMEALEETQYARQISDQKAMLSDLYDTYELILNQRLDNVDALLADLIEMVNLNSGSTKESIAALQEANGGYVNVINGQISYVGGLNSTWFSTLNNTDTIGYAGVQSAVLNGTNNISTTNNAGYANMQGSILAGANSLNATNSLGYTSIKDTLTATSMGINAANATGYTSIKDTLSQAANNVGYKISEEMESIWSSDGDADRVVSLYSDLVSSRIGTTNSKLDSINSVINGIAINIGNMVAASNKKAETTVKKTTPTTATNTKAEPVAPTPKPTPKPVEAPKQTGRTDQEKYGVAIAIWNGLQGWGAGQDRKNKLEQKGFNYDEVQGIVNKIRGDILSNSWSGKYYGITASDIPKYAYSKFKSGGIVDYTGIAQVDGTPGKPEAFLNAEDTKNFIILKDTLRSIMNGKASLSGSASSLGLFSGLTGVTKLQGMHSSSVGDITYQINIPIDHVTDYDDFVNKMRSDTKFEKLIQSMTIGQLAGQSSITKNKYKW